MGEGRTLVIGFGNPGRGDDGLGPALADAVERLGLPGVTVETDYQLAAEHAVDINAHDTVLFVDAAISGPEPYSLARVAPVDDLPWSTHGLEPRALLALARHVRDRDEDPRAYLLAIRGYDFEELHEELTQGARRNLADAIAFVASALRDGDLEAAAARTAVTPSGVAP
jgi:hydrogenase maturation protease